MNAFIGTLQFTDLLILFHTAAGRGFSLIYSAFLLDLDLTGVSDWTVVAKCRLCLS